MNAGIRFSTIGDTIAIEETFVFLNGTVRR